MALQLVGWSNGKRIEVTEFKQLSYVQDSVRLDTKRSRNLKDATHEELVATDEGMELMASMEEVRKADPRLKGEILLAIDGEWLRARLFPNPKPSKAQVVACLKGLK